MLAHMNLYIMNVKQYQLLVHRLPGYILTVYDSIKQLSLLS